MIYEGRNFCFKTDVVELPNGLHTIRDIVDHPGAVGVIPVLPDGRILLIKQYRYAVQRELLEIPAGTLEKGEESAHCANRELREETGYIAGRMEKLLSCYMAPGYSSEMVHIFVATKLTRKDAEPELDEDIAIAKMDPDELDRKIRNNVIVDAKTIAGMLAYFHRQ